jgi:uncharacterized protein YjdB
MQLFSRNKAIVALSLGALALGACGDDVTVPVAPAAPITLSITPPSANMNIGEAVNFAVQISGGATAPTLASCTTSSATVATAAVSGSSCRVTAVAAGNATITATASTGQSAAASVSVAAPAAAISGLQVSPSAASVQVNQTVTIVPTVNKGAAAVAVAYTYATSTASVATVTAAGVVTAVAPGVATITVTATGTGTGFASTTLTSAAAITVTALPSGMTSLNVTPTTLALAARGTAQIVASAQQPTGAAAASIIYGTTAPAIATVSTTGLVTAVGPGTAVITVTATSAANANFAAATLSGTVAVTVSPAAQVIISSLTKMFLPVDISNVFGQFEVNLALQPNGQNVSSVQAWVCNEGETVEQCATRSGSPAAQQTFGASGGQAGTVQLYINSAEFATPNFTSGENAKTLYTNGLKTIVATLTISGASPTASNNLSSINFNNGDGFTLAWTLPTRKEPDAAGNTWYGGPGAIGTGSFTVVPVLYTKDRDITSVTLAPADGACGAAMVDATRPFSATYGAQARDTSAKAFNCTSVATDLNGHAPIVTASLDNANAAGPVVSLGAPAVGASIFNPITATTNNGLSLVGSGTKYYQSLAYRSTAKFVPADWQAPVITRLEVRGGGATSVDSGWVNAAYAFNRVIDPATGATSYQLNDNANGVGLFPTAQRNTQFSVCTVPATVSTTEATTCASPVATGPLTATVGSMKPTLPEAADGTNQAYQLYVTETDRLLNRVTSNPFTYTTEDGTINETDNRDTFGVDLTAPVVAPVIPNLATANDVNNPGISGVRSGIDSIFTVGTNTYTATSGAGEENLSATTAKFGVRVTDERSGFYSCTAAVSCTSSSGSEFHLGTFQITRRRIPNSPLATNAATVDSIIATPTTLVPTFANVMNGTAPVAGTGLRDFSINIWGNVARKKAGLADPSSAQAGYYTFTGTFVDRAGNTAAAPTKNVVIDNTAPVLDNVILPASYTGGTIASLTLQASDDLEVMGAELRLGFPQAGFGAIYFPRVTNFAATARTGLFQSPFAALTSNKLATPTGLGQFFNGQVSLPIPFVQDLQLAANLTGVVSQPGLGTAEKPNTIGARVLDVRALATPTGGTTPLTIANTMSAFENRTISPSNVSSSTLRKNWGASEDVGGGVINPGAQIAEWIVYNSGTSTNSVVEFRARALTSSASVPFTTVYVVMKRFNLTSGLYEDYEYRGPATYAGSIDDGGVRYFRYTASATQLAASAQNNNVTLAAFTGVDSIRAIGVDASGNALATPAAIPGTTTVPRVITAVATGRMNVFSGGSANYSAAGGWYTRSNAAVQVVSATDLSGDTRLFVGYDPTTATARLYFPITLASGVAATTAGNTTVTCTSSNPTDLVVVADDVGSYLATGTASTLQPYCDVRGANANLSTLTVTVTRAAEGPYAAATAANTFITSAAVYTADPTITALGAVSAISASTALGTGRTATFTIGAPTYYGTYSIANTTMQYVVNLTAGATGVSAAVTVNAITNGATVTVTCSESAVTNNRAYTFEVLGRGVSLSGYSAPLKSGTTVTGSCSVP